jgi:hypothetical protein
VLYYTDCGTSMIGTLISLIPYVLASGTIVLGLVEFVRKWEEHKNKPLRTAIFTALILMGALTIVSLRLDRNEKERKDKNAEEANRKLQKKLDLATKAENTAIQDQKNTTAQFLTKFENLSGELSDIKQQVATVELQKKVASLQAELQKTQKAMAPGPKAKLTFTFAPYTNPPIIGGHPGVVVPITDTTLPVSADGSVHVEFTVLNLSQANALNIGLTLALCEGCKFKNEPEGFHKLLGDSDEHRWINLPALHPAEAFRTISVDLILPRPISAFVMGVQYRCDTCPNDSMPSAGTVHLVIP